MKVRPEVLETIRAHALRDSPRECCGILVGVDQTIVEAVPAANVAEEPLRRYEVSPADHFAQIKRCRAAGGPHAPRIVGVYHSHPHSAPVPSPTDLDQAFEEYVYVIAGPVDAAASFVIRGYRLASGKFEEIALTAEGGPDHLRQGRVAERPDQAALAGRSAEADRPGGPPKL
jgi:proteasome lid subunit RPN8/RPN11